MKKILSGLAVCGGLALADSVTCTTGGNPPTTQVPCNSLGVFDTTYSGTGPYVSFGTSGNSITARINVTLQYSYSQEPNYPFWFGQATQFNDTLKLDVKPGDLLTFSGEFGALSSGGSTSSAQDRIAVGPGSSASPTIALSAGNDGVPIYCEFHSCTYAATLPADSYSYLTLQGQAILQVQPCTTNASNYCADQGANVYDYVTIQQFKSDGNTPDPFAPEPSTCFLIIVGLSALAGLTQRRAKQRFTSNRESGNTGFNLPLPEFRSRNKPLVAEDGKPGLTRNS